MLRKPPLPYLVVWRLVPWLCRGRRPHGDGNRLVFGGVVGCEAMLRPVGCAFPRRAVLCCAVLCCAVLCCVVLCRALLSCVGLCCVARCCAVLCCAVLCCAVLCCAVLCCAVLCCAALCRFVFCCGVPCRAVPSCVVLCYATLCCAVVLCAMLRRCFGKGEGVPCCTLPPRLGRGRPLSSTFHPLDFLDTLV